MQQRSVIKFFRESEAYGEFSNFWRLTEPLPFNGVMCATTEHAYQMQKFVYDGCPIANAAYAHLIATANTPYSAKILAGQKCIGRSLWQRKLFEKIEAHKNKGAAIDPDWDARRDDVMHDVLRRKFLLDKRAQSVLLSTGDALLLENSKYDAYWGAGPNGDGKNMLGQLLMRVRDEISAGNLLFGVSGITQDAAGVWGK